MALPEVGQQVQVRNGPYVVQEVQHTPAELRNDGSKRPATTRVRLTSLRDELLGQSLEVLWELEPGAEIREDQEMPQPSGFDAPHRLDAFLNAVRWGAVVQADHDYFQAPFRSGVQAEAYQLDPVVRAIAMPRANLLIADDVGLGKTIEAGLVIQELMLRGKARTVFIVCPSALQVQWQEQMRDKFGLAFEIVDRDYLKQLRRKRGPRANPWNSFPRLITSIDYVKRPTPSRLLQDVLGSGQGLHRALDVLVVDEAHCVAPASSGKYVVDSQRTHAIRRLAPHFEHKLFLTATPHNGDPNSWTALLELLDNQRFTRGVMPSPEQRSRVMVRRMKSQLVDDLGEKRFPDRILRELVVHYADEERELHRAFGDYARLRKDRAQSPQERYALEFSIRLLKKRLFSSPGSFWKSIEHHSQRLQETTRKPAQRSLRQEGLRMLRRYLDSFEAEDFGSDADLDEALTEKLTYAADQLSPLSDAEQALLDTLRAGGKRANSLADSKAKVLLAWLHEHLRPNGTWNQERVILFTEYRDTLSWLMQHLEREGFTRNQRTLTIYGGMPSDEREQVKAAFQTDPAISNVRILLATDAAGEGLDLQNFCRYLIHYEIPWNPNRLEQRNGRIDRHGQRHSPEIFHFVGEGFDRHRDLSDLNPGSLEGDLEFLAIAAFKVDRIREDLGVVGPVIAENVEKAMLGERCTLDTRKAEEDAKAIKDTLSFETNQRARIRELEQASADSKKALHLNPEAIAEVVHIGLELAGQPRLEPATLNRRSALTFRLPQLSGSWSTCTAGLRHPHTGVLRPITFDPDTARGHDDVVLVHLNHRLVQLAQSLLRAEVWASRGDEKLHRMCARAMSPNSTEKKPVLVVHARLVMLGATHQRLHEELLIAGGFLNEGQFTLASDDAALERLLLEATDKEPVQHRLATLQTLYETHRNALHKALVTRVQRRAQTLETLLEKQKTEACAKVNRIFDDLEASLHAKLAEPTFAKQLDLFEGEVKDQLQADHQALLRRKKGLPKERDRELALARSRYEGLSVRYFPVAITWLLPPSYCR